MSTTNYETVCVDIKDEIAWVAFNRPEKRNGMRPQFGYEMVDV